MSSKRKCAIFCASSMDRNKRYLQRIKDLIRELSKDYSIVYGGANTGYMKEVALTVKENEGYLIGVMPEFLEAKELRFDACDEWIESTSMNHRKETIMSMSDCFVALPGGVGTYEEIIDILSWMHIGLIQKPLVLYNLDNFYDPLLKQILRGIDDEMIQPSMLDSFLVSDDIVEISEFLSQDQQELWDIYDVNRKPIAKVIKRDQAHRLLEDKEFHLVTYLIIKNQKDEVLLINDGDQWDLIGGSVLAFETSLESVKRHNKKYLNLDLSDVDYHLSQQLTSGHSHIDVYQIRLDDELKIEDQSSLEWFDIQQARALTNFSDIKLSWCFPQEYIV